MNDVSTPVRLGRLVSWILAAFVLLAVPALLLRDHHALGFSSRQYLVAASTAYILVCLLRGGLGSTVGRLILAGLLGCWVGDYVGPLGADYFIYSVLAFGVAHLFFIWAFLAHGVTLKRAAGALIPLVPAGVVIGLWLVPSVEASLKLPVAAYMAVITVMVLAAWGMRDGPGRTILVVAAVLFYVSDIFVARWKFVAPGDPLNAFLCYPLYYTSCLLFAFSVSFYAVRGEQHISPGPSAEPGAES